MRFQVDREYAWKLIHWVLGSARQRKDGLQTTYRLFWTERVAPTAPCWATWHVPTVSGECCFPIRLPSLCFKAPSRPSHQVGIPEKLKASQDEDMQDRHGRVKGLQANHSPQSRQPRAIDGGPRTPRHPKATINIASFLYCTGAIGLFLLREFQKTRYAAHAPAPASRPLAPPRPRSGVHG